MTERPPVAEKHSKKLSWDRVSREDVEHCARFPSVAAQNILQEASKYNSPVFYSLHIGVFAVIEKEEATSIFQLGTRASRAKQAAGQRKRWVKYRNRFNHV